MTGPKVRDRPERVARKLGLYFAIEPTPESIARLSQWQILRVPTVGRRSLESVAAWVERAGLKLSERGEVAEPPRSRGWNDHPWETPEQTKKRRKREAAANALWRKSRGLPPTKP